MWDITLQVCELTLAPHSKDLGSMISNWEYPREAVCQLFNCWWQLEVQDYKYPKVSKYQY